MPRATASSACTSVCQQKLTLKKVAEATDTTPPSSPVVLIPTTPRAQHVSPRKKIVPDSDTPAVQIRASATPLVSHRLFFGSVIEGDISASQSDGCSDCDLQPVACNDSDIEVLKDAAAPSPSHKVAK
ncbi:hypothetical protein BDN71DRAFT_1507280 [Pleurotus eryngii]|uniref:Uncharacterized protein n=1 Tax=Pleurotus eryngii TaxID=5323 RepID=A0A9P5ZYD8_PLEER|nr:hypothetical protein BDN71DRAFT_1507280 [Pleurotus eryngii]